MSINKVILIGNVGSDPIVKNLENDLKVANFSLATSESYTNQNGEKITVTEWHNIVAWKGLAGIVEKYVKKGMQIYIEGKIKSRSYENKEQNKVYVTEIYADHLQMLGAKPKSESAKNDTEPKDDLPY